MFRFIKNFHEKTMEEYKKGLEENMEPWKKKVMEIHDQASYLFYVEEVASKMPQGTSVIRGDRVKGNGRPYMALSLLDGQGEELAKGVFHSEMQEQEERRKWFVVEQKQEFQMKITQIGDQMVDELDAREYRNMLQELLLDLSLIINADTELFPDINKK
ncbi:MAG: hypothetical protein Q4E53_02905 [Eubacteriales bacterium]|nr:hypothetical protein [Eubacteriales bacterium]